MVRWRPKVLTLQWLQLLFGIFRSLYKGILYSSFYTTNTIIQLLQSFSFTTSFVSSLYSLQQPTTLSHFLLGVYVFFKFYIIERHSGLPNPTSLIKFFTCFTKIYYHMLPYITNHKIKPWYPESWTSQSQLY